VNQLEGEFFQAARKKLPARLSDTTAKYDPFRSRTFPTHPVVYGSQDFTELFEVALPVLPSPMLEPQFRRRVCAQKDTNFRK
jgi:hypothetical protein